MDLTGADLKTIATTEEAAKQVGVEVTFGTLPEEFLATKPAIRAHIEAAIQEWTRHFHVEACSLEVDFSIREWPARGAGRSFVSASFKNERHDRRYVSEEGMAQELRTGKDPNGDAPDIEMFFDPAYFRTLWFDPDPKARTALMPAPDQQKLDAFSVILHELGHAIGFNGFRDPKTGQLPGEFLSVYDRWVSIDDGGHFHFTGPKASALYGGPIPLARTNTNYHHVGEKGDHTDPKLARDLMNGVKLDWSHRYYISPLDIAILSDCGVPTR
jgi:hypothetical protein